MENNIFDEDYKQNLEYFAKKEKVRNIFKLYNSKKSYFLQNTYSEYVLEIEKISNNSKIIKNNVFYDLLIIDSFSLHCFIGLVEVQGLKFILYVSSAELIGKIHNKHDVFIIKEANYYCIEDKRDDEIPKEVKSNLVGICSLLTLGFFYSFTYDLTSNFQRQETIKQNILSELNSGKLKIQNNFVFNSNFLEKKGDLKELVDEHYMSNLFQFARRKYFWNYNLTKFFEDINKKYYLQNKDSLNCNKKFYLEGFVVGIICGFFSQSPIVANPTNIKNNLKFDFALISRRSTNYAGTRFNRRGIDKNGHVANFVETEQITNFGNTIFSYIQLRGSAPVFFQQTGIKNKTSILSASCDEFSINAFKKHLIECTKDSQYMMMINLLDNENEKEKEIIKTFEEEIRLTQGTPEIQKSKYVYFNFHKECKGEEYTSIEKKLLVSLEKILKMFGFFSYNKENNTILSIQKGVFRTNCLDSLDRTNVVQTRIAYEVMKMQFMTFNVDLDKFTTLTNFTNETFFCSNIENDEILSTFKEFWGNNGDLISLQYTGTESCKTSITKTGKSEFKEKLFVAIDRFIKSNFEDKAKQDCINILVLNEPTSLSFDESKIDKGGKYNNLNNSNYSSNSYSNSNYEKKKEPEIFRKDSSNNHKLLIFTGSWNVAGEEIFKEQELRLSEWLYPNPKIVDGNVPDIYVISFQEIVSLNATYILFKSNSSVVDSWKSHIQDTLNLISNKYEKNFDHSTDEFIIFKTLELVGILMFVFVKRKYFSHIKNIDFLIKKTGAMGHLGNKGSVLYRFDLFDKSFAFSSGHFAAGQTALKNRVEELGDILNSNIIANPSKVTFKGKLSDHEYWFILGDLNFRIDLDNEQVRNLIKSKEYEKLASYDQLNKLKIEDSNFYSIDEGKISFPPTYKYNIGSSEYETKKNRVPSWCDRIVFKRNKSILQLDYDSIQKISFSDHKPIYSHFLVSVPHEDFIIKKGEPKSFSYKINLTENKNDEKEFQRYKSFIDKENEIESRKEIGIESNQKRGSENISIFSGNAFNDYGVNHDFLMQSKNQQNYNTNNTNNEKKINNSFKHKPSDTDIELSLFNNIPDIPTSSPYSSQMNRNYYSNKNNNNGYFNQNVITSTINTNNVSNNITNKNKNLVVNQINNNLFQPKSPSKFPNLTTQGQGQVQGKNEFGINVNTNNSNTINNLLDLDSNTNNNSNTKNNQIEKKDTKEMLNEIFLQKLNMNMNNNKK